MSGRLARRPRYASAGGQELQPCEVKSSMAHGPSAGLRASAGWGRPPIATAMAAPAAAAVPIIRDRRPGIKNFVIDARCSPPSDSTNQQTVRKPCERRLLDSIKVTL